MLKSIFRYLTIAVLLTSCQTPIEPDRGGGELEALLDQAATALRERTPEGISTAARLYRQAAELDPARGESWAGLAESSTLLGLYGIQVPSKVMPEAGMAAERALTIDPENALIHAVHGLVQYLHQWDWKGAESSFKRAIEIDPRLVEAYHWSAMLFSATGRHEEALENIRKAASLNPESPLYAVKVGTILANAGRLKEAQNILQTAASRFPKFTMVWDELGLLALRRGDNQMALEHFSKALELDAASDRALAGMAVAYKGLGQSDSVQKISEQLETLSLEAYVSPEIWAEVLLASGSPAKALDQLEQGVEQRDPGLVYLLTRPGLVGLWNEPRFRNLITRMGLRASDPSTDSGS